MKKAVIYIRKAIGDKVDVEIKKEQSIDLCKKQGWEVSEVYIDNGFSGGNMDRPGLRKMLQDAKDKKFDILFVQDVNMLSRWPEDALEISKTLKNIALMSIKWDAVIEIKHDDIFLESSVANAIREEMKETIKSEIKRTLG